MSGGVTEKEFFGINGYLGLAPLFKKKTIDMMNIQFGKTRIREMMERARKVVVYEGHAVIYMRYAIDGEWDTRSTSTWVTGGDKTAALVEAEKRGTEVVYGEMCETSQREMPLER